MASGGQAPSGFGRGGRGAALLQALQNPPRRPGESSSSSQTSSQTPAPSRSLGSSFGRGASLQRALGTPSSVSSTQASASHSGASAPRTPLPVPVGRGILGRGLKMSIEEPQTRQEQASQQQPKPTPFGRGIARRAQQVESDTDSAASSQTESQARPASSPFGRGIARRAQQTESPSSVSTVERERTGGRQQVQTSAPFGRGIARRAQESQASAMRTPSETEMEGSAASSQTGRRVTTLEERFSRMDVSDELVEERGTYGEEMPLSANYIPVRCRYDGTYQYAVSFSPQIDSLGMRKKIIHNHEDTIGSVHAFDGSILYVPKQLRGPEITLKDRRPTDGQEITVHIKLVKALHPESCVHIYNIILRKIMRILKYSQIGRQYYDPHRPAQIPQHKMEVWPGYVQTIKRYSGGLMLQIDVSHRVLRTDTVLDVMHDIQRTNPNRAIEEITRKVVGTTVLTRYNNRTYRIDDIEWKKTPRHTFPKGREGEEVSYITYYKNMYNKTIRDDNQPLLVHRPKQKAPPGVRKQLEAIVLVPELCFCTGLTDEIRSDFRVMKDLATHTRITPEQRVIAIRNFCENVRECPEACLELDKWGLKIDSETINTRGRYLGRELILMGQNRSQDSGDRADFTRFVTSSEVITPINLRNWLVVTTKKDLTRARQLVDEMGRVCRQIGIVCTLPTITTLENDRAETYLKCLREKINKEVQIVVMIMPTSRDDRYNAVKKLTCVEIPVPSQVINSRTISRPDKLRSIVTKIALQMNCKLGGELWGVKIPGKLLMVIGVDVYHDGKSRKGQSIGAFVASMNGSCTRWYSRVAFQQPGQELIDSLKVCFTAAIRKFHEVNGTHPERIIVFRDGVGDGDLPSVAGYEAKQLVDCFQHFGASYRPKFAIIVVQKRINTKLFAVLNSRRGCQYQNPPPGTVIDHTITRRNWLDFFLVSQHVGQGTVNPTHYVVVHDDSGWDIDKLQRLAYKMTHLYYNWTGTIRVPAPCQYAHKLAYLVGQNIKKDPDIHLTDRLFFL